jgi:hypothetical protein
MEGAGLISRTIAELTNIIYQNTDLRALPQLAARAHSLGLPIRQEFTI